MQRKFTFSKISDHNWGNFILNISSVITFSSSVTEKEKGSKESLRGGWIEMERIYGLESAGHVHRHLVRLRDEVAHSLDL
jgi:hypothetical protein